MSGKVLVLGATGTVGRSTSIYLEDAGYTVFGAARNIDELNGVEGLFARSNTVLDIKLSDSVATAVKEAKEALGGLDAIVNCVGSLHLKSPDRTTDEELNDVVATNLLGNYYVIREAAKTLRSNGGSVVLFSSAAAQIGLANHEAIASAKAGVEAMVRSAATTYARNKIRFNAIAPGLTESKMTASIFSDEVARRMSYEMCSASRLGEGEDMARVVELLINPTNQFMNGAVINVDGGLATTKPRPVVTRK
ncbi:MAG: SDR family NAD(P)-dependent oxidoreductase [Actinomycetota bacterium]|nr:SDR family NAD(P)-dependent oxidoreductase [Actinomycetota bacterium]